MSILKEYEEIHKRMGDEKWNLLDKYCTHKNILLSRVLYNEEEYTNFELWCKIVEFAEFEELTIEEAEKEILASWGELGLRGYGIFVDDYTNARHIQRIDELVMYDGDDEATTQAEKDGIKIVPKQELKSEWKNYNFIDDEDNRKILKIEHILK